VYVPRISTTSSRATRASPRSSVAVRNMTARQVGSPSQPRIRRCAAHRLHRPSSPMMSRPPGFSTRAISTTARSASRTKQRTVATMTRSKTASSNGSLAACPSTMFSRMLRFRCGGARRRSSQGLRRVPLQLRPAEKAQTQAHHRHSLHPAAFCQCRTIATLGCQGNIERTPPRTALREVRCT
jgi:hypothetical protein